MIKKNLLICLFMVSLLMVATIPALGEYYQYTDQNGNIRFTDDLYEVPEDQRANMQTHESVQTEKAVQSDSVFPPVDDDTFSDSPSMTDTADKSEQSSAKTFEQELKLDAETLDQRQSDLSRTFKSLEAEKKAIEDQKPPKGASSRVMGPYVDKVEALNAKIEKYERQREEFDKKVRAFNSRVKQ